MRWQSQVMLGASANQAHWRLQAPPFLVWARRGGDRKRKTRGSERLGDPGQVWVLCRKGGAVKWGGVIIAVCRDSRLAPIGSPLSFRGATERACVDIRLDGYTCNLRDGFPYPSS